MAKGGQSSSSMQKAAVSDEDKTKQKMRSASKISTLNNGKDKFYATISTSNKFLVLESTSERNIFESKKRAGNRSERRSRPKSTEVETNPIAQFLPEFPRTTSVEPLDYADDVAGRSSRPFVASHLKCELKSQRKRKRDMAWPYVQKGMLSGLIYMLGEAISCGLLSREGRVGFYADAFIRYSVLHSTLIGMFVNGPMLHLFFEMVDRYVKFKSALLNVVLKVVVDQIVWGCLWNFSYILLMNVATDSPGFGYVGEGLGLDFIVDLYKGVNSAFWKAIDWRLHAQLLQEGLKMLPMDIICYWLVPLRLRAIWVVSVDVFWVTILSQYD